MLLLIRVFGRKGEHRDATIELTVVVDGTIISGSVVSEQAWGAETERSSPALRELDR